MNSEPEEVEKETKTGG